MTHDLRDKIKMYVKNGIDISPLIEGIDIKGEDFSGAIIKTFNRVNDNISDIKLERAIIGEKGKVTNLSGTKMINCKCGDMRFLGKVFLRRCNCEDSDFSGADFSNVEYQKTNFRGCKFCETLIRLGSSYGTDATFDSNLFKELTKNWRLKVEVLPPKE